MDFVRIDPHNKMVEEGALFDLAGMICPENAGLLPDPEAFKKYVEPLLTVRGVHAEAIANFVTFSIIGRDLRPHMGNRRILPQTSPEWLAFRRLFLEICDLDIPEKMLRSPIRSMADENSTAHSGLCKEEDEHPTKHSPKPELGLGEGAIWTGPVSRPPWDMQELGVEAEPVRTEPDFQSIEPLQGAETYFADGVTWIERETVSDADATEEEDFAEGLAILKHIVEVRLKNYEGVNLQQMRADFVEFGRIEVDEQCGALYKVTENISWRAVPKTLDFPEDSPEVTTLQLLKEIVEEGSIEFDMTAEYQKAARSVREVIFETAVEVTFGEIFGSDADTQTLEEKAFERQLVENPYTLITDENAVLYLADGMARRGGSFLERLASLFKTAERNDETLRHPPLRYALATQWLNPNFPLWLMQIPAIKAFLGTIESPEKYLTGDKVRDTLRERKGGRSPLVQGEKLLIQEVFVIRGAEKNHFAGMEFPVYLQGLSLYERLQDHVDMLVSRSQD